MDDIAFLITEVYMGTDRDGNIMRKRTPHRVFCDVKSVTRTEFYDASTHDLKPDLNITISHRIDYNGEKLLVYDGQVYDVIRSYWDGDQVDLTVQARIGETLQRDGYLVMPDGCRLEMPDDNTLLISY